jgi:hypothetical protein
MKTFFTKIVLSILLLLMVSNCGTIQSTFISPTPILLNKPEISDFEEVYIPQEKSARKNFFKDSEAETHWADSIYNQMKLQEKVGQLFMVAAYSNKDSNHINAIDKLIKNRTSIIIAHRLSTIEKANKVMVLQKGVIQFLGTYDEAKKLGYLH